PGRQQIVSAGWAGAGGQTQEQARIASQLAGHKGGRRPAHRLMIVPYLDLQSPGALPRRSLHAHRAFPQAGGGGYRGTMEWRSHLSFAYLNPKTGLSSRSVRQGPLCRCRTEFFKSPESMGLSARITFRGKYMGMNSSLSLFPFVFS